MRPLILEFLSAREISPAALVRLAARNQVPSVSICLIPFQSGGVDPVPFSDLIDWHLIGDTVNRRELKRVCDGEGVEIASADPFILGPENDPETARPALESAAWLGAREVMGIAYDADATRLRDRMGAFCAVAADYGLVVLQEHSPRMTIKTVKDALAFQRDLGADNLKLVIDALHFFRGDNALVDLADVRPGELARLQLSDGPAEVPSKGGGWEAFHERMLPGEGTFPLKDLVSALPDGLAIGMEVPLWSLQEAGVQAAERVERIVTASRMLLDGLQS